MTRICNYPAGQVIFIFIFIFIFIQLQRVRVTATISFCGEDTKNPTENERKLNEGRFNTFAQQLPSSISAVPRTLLHYL